MWFMKLRPWPVRIQTAALSLSLSRQQQQLQVMWNLYRSNCKLSKYILTAITTQSLFPLVEHKTEGLDALWRHPGRRQVPIFAPRHEARRAITKMFITYRLSLYDFFLFFFFFPFLLCLAPSIITSSQGLICIHSLGAALSPGRLKWWRVAIVKRPRLRKLVQSSCQRSHSARRTAAYAWTLLSLRLIFRTRVGLASAYRSIISKQCVRTCLLSPGGWMMASQRGSASCLLTLTATI